MSRHWSAWREERASELIVDILREGARFPVSHRAREERTLPQSPETAGAVKELIRRGALEKGSPLLVAPFFAIPKRGSSELRPIHDLRVANERMIAQAFRLRTFEQAVRLAPSHPFMTKFDLRHGYQQVLVHPKDRPLLGARVDGVLYQAVSLPFGAALSPIVFQKITSQLCRLAGNRGLLLLAYLDDFLLLSDSLETAREEVKILKILLKKLGAVTHPAKWEGPTTRLEFLGIVLDSGEKRLGISEERKDELCKLLELRQKQSRWTRLQRKQLAGKLLFLSKIFPFAKVFTKDILRVPRNSSTRLRPSAGARAEITFWLRILEDPSSPWPSPHATAILATDASREGGGGVLRKQGRVSRFSCKWNQEEQRHHITYLELLALLKALTHLQLKNETLLWHTDATAAAASLRKGSSSSPTMTKLAQSVWCLARRRGVVIFPQHIRGVFNTEADLLSRPSGAKSVKEDPSWEEVIVKRLGPLNQFRIGRAPFLLPEGRCFIHTPEELQEVVLGEIVSKAIPAACYKTCLSVLAMMVTPLSPRAVLLLKKNKDVLKSCVIPREAEPPYVKQWRASSGATKPTWIAWASCPPRTAFAAQARERDVVNFDERSWSGLKGTDIEQ